MHSTADTRDTTLDGLNFLWLEITGKCNLTCNHCYAESGPMGDLYGNMAYEDWVCVLDQAADLGCRRVQFIGGEPTMHPRLKDMVDHANNRGFEMIEIFTNATRLSEELVGCFQRNKVQVATSFYSEQSGVHDSVTQVSGSWARTVHGIRRLVAAGLPIRVGIIETQANRGHAPQAVEFLNRLGVQHVGVDRERRVGRGELIALGGEGERFDQLCGQCWKGKLCVTPSGDSFPCVFARATRLGNIKENGILPILQCARLRVFRSILKQRSRDWTRVEHQDNASCRPYCSPQIICNPESGCSPNQPDPDCSPRDLH